MKGATEDPTDWGLRMIALYNVYLAGGALPDAGGLLDQDWEIVRAFLEVLAPRFGGIPDHVARRSIGI